MQMVEELTQEEIQRLASLVQTRIEEDEEYINKYGDHELPAPEGNSVKRELELFNKLLEKIMGVEPVTRPTESETMDEHCVAHISVDRGEIEEVFEKHGIPVTDENIKAYAKLLKDDVEEYVHCFVVRDSMEECARLMKSELKLK